MRRNLGSTRGDLALTRRWLISMAVVANITFHLWLTTLFNGTTIVPPESLAHDHREYETLSLSLGSTPLQSMSESPYQLDKIALTSYSTTCGQAQSTPPHYRLRISLSPGSRTYFSAATKPPTTQELITRCSKPTGSFHRKTVPSLFVLTSNSLCRMASLFSVTQ
jgi:hypothetical protein